MGSKVEIKKTPVNPTSLRRHMIMAWETLTKRVVTNEQESDQEKVSFYYDTPAKHQVALLMAQWGVEQGGGEQKLEDKWPMTYNYNLTGIKYPGPSHDRYKTDYYFAATEEVFLKEVAQGYVKRGGALGG